MRYYPHCPPLLWVLPLSLAYSLQLQSIPALVPLYPVPLSLPKGVWFHHPAMVKEILLLSCLEFV